VNPSAAVGRHIEQQHGVRSHRGEIDLLQRLERPHLLILRGVVEPARADRHVHLRGIPEQLLRFVEDRTAAQIGRGLGEGFDGGRRVLQPDTRRGQGRGAPLLGASPARFVTHPADVVAHDGRDGSGLQLLHGAYVTGPVVNLMLAVGLRAVGAVEPYLGDLAVAGQQFGDLPHEKIVVGLPRAVTGGVAVPRRDVETHFHTVLVA